MCPLGKNSPAGRDKTSLQNLSLSLIYGIITTPKTRKATSGTFQAATKGEETAVSLQALRTFCICPQMLS